MVMNETSDKANRPGQSDGRYMAMVGTLLVVIVAALAVLWLNERIRRTNAEQQVIQLRSENARLRAVVGQLAIPPQALPPAPAEENAPTSAPAR